MSIADGFALWVGKALAEVFLGAVILGGGLLLFAAWVTVSYWLDRFRNWRAAHRKGAST